MEFGAASAIPEKYRQILADEELVGRLAYRISAHSIEPEDGKALASEFGTFLKDLANENMVGRLVDMRGRAGGKERKMVQSAIDAGLERIGRNGAIAEPVELLKRGDIPLKIRRALADAVLEGMEVCAGGGRVSLVVELLGKEWLSEEIHMKALETAGKSHYVDYEEYMEKTIELLGKEWASPGLKEEAERALMEWGIEKCLERADPNETGGLLRLDDGGRIVTEGIDKGKLVSLVLGLAANGNAGEAVRIKAVEEAAACPHVDKEMLENALADVLEKEVRPGLMGAVEKALEECGAHKFAAECAGKAPEELLQMRAAAKTGEKRFVDGALIERFEELALGGRTDELAAVLERKDLTQRLRAEGEKCLLEAADACSGDAEGLFRLMRKEWLPEKVHMGAIGNVRKNPDACRMRFVEALGDVLARRRISRELRTAAEKALPEAVEGCIRKRDGKHDVGLGAAASLFRKNGVPWGMINRVAEECNKTCQWTKVADLFRRSDLPQETAGIAERVLLESMDHFGGRALAEGAAPGEKELIGYVVKVLWKKRLPESAYLKGIELCRRHPGVQGYGFVKVLGDIFSRPGATQKVKDAAEGALVEEEVWECAAAGYTDFLFEVRKMSGLPEKVGESIRQAFEMRRRMEEKEAGKGAEEAAERRQSTPVSLSGDQGFVGFRFRPPKGADGPAAEKLATDPTRKAKMVKKN